MKYTAASCLLVLCAHAQADCQDNWFTYQSDTLSLSVDYSQGCYQGPRILSFSTHPVDRSRRSRPAPRVSTVPFDRECPVTKKDQSGEVVEFSCRKDGVSPLAGATYRFKKFKSVIECEGVKAPSLDFTFICVDGCGPATPPRLEVSAGEGCA